MTVDAGTVFFELGEPTSRLQVICPPGRDDWSGAAIVLVILLFVAVMFRSKY